MVPVVEAAVAAVTVEVISFITVPSAATSTKQVLSTTAEAQSFVI